jgi:NADH:ubiquinone oxidoreductase subunit 3 (subunit A)
MDKILLSPPMAFIIILAVILLASRLASIISFKSKIKADGRGEPYACGEDNYDHAVQPDYSNFFAFAFFFTIAHVAALIMTTVHAENITAFILAGLYIIAAITGLYILMRD